ncbi:hypothetical protein AVEN_234760-1, partial [Araneus ventricosus]
HDRRARGDKHEKTKLAKIIVECIREGMVSYLTGDYLDGRQKWEKCRLVLVKTTGGYMLEFYSPPKVLSWQNASLNTEILERKRESSVEIYKLDSN